MRTVDQAKNDMLRDEILNAAQELFGVHGLALTTMERIAEVTGKSKATIYYYFKNKEDVVSALINRGRARASEEIEKTLGQCKSAEARIRTFFRARAEIISKMSELYPLMYKEQKKYIELFYRLRRENTSQEASILKRLLIEGVRSGEFKSITEADCETLARVEIESFQGRYLKQVFDGKKHINTDADNVILDVFIRGLK